MDKKIFFYLCLIFYGPLVLQIQIINGIKVDNCIFNCKTPSQTIYSTSIYCTAHCDQPTQLIDKSSLMDIFKNNGQIQSIRNINWIKITSNNIFAFNSNYFCSFDHFKKGTLQLFNNKLNDSTKIGLGDIKECENDNSTCENSISNLYLDGNPLKILKNNSFCHLKNLTKLFISNCDLTSIEFDAFKFNNNLKDLTVNNNQLSQIPHLGHFKSLVNLFIANSLITSIKNEDLVNCKDLQRLYLAGNRISHIEDKAFDQLGKLYTLNLNNNKLTTISHAFGKLSAYDLHLESNLLTELNMLNFSNNLEYLEVNWNFLTEVPANLGNTKLKTIGLSGNKMKLINELELPATIETISFDGNEMEYFSMQSKYGLYLFSQINLANNKLQIVDNNRFAADIYDLNNNPIACSCENSWLVKNPKAANSIHVPQWTNSGQLHDKSEVIIWLDGNNISLLTNTSFIDYYNVIQLYVNNSLIEEIDHFAFDNMTKLILLDLSHNLLTTIEENTFDELINLQILVLCNNKLRQLPDNSFDNLKSIQFLYLHDNNMINYPVWKLEKLSTIKELTLNKNPWKCRCGFVKKFHTFLTSHLNVLTNANEINCVDGNKTFPVSYHYSSKCLPQNKNCSINCEILKHKSKIDKVSISVNCNDSTTFTNTKHDIDDIIKSNCFHNYSFINAIELTDSNLNQLKIDFFCPIDFLNSKNLSLINNQLNDSTKIGFGDPNNCSSMSKCKFHTLETLILNGNPLKKLKNNSFCYLKELKQLYLSNCSLKTIEKDAFLNLDKLEYLNLNDNQLNRIPYNAHLKSLLELRIANNMINLEQNFAQFQTLKLIDLSHNNITEFKFLEFFNDQLRVLNLSHNKVRDIYNLHFGVSKVEILDLSYNRLIFASFAHIPQSLLSLYLKGNFINDIWSFASYEIFQLTFLDLSNNEFQRISKQYLPPTLKTIDLSDNKINELLIYKQHIQNLISLNLTNNSLSILPQTDLGVEIFNLTNNPIACNCENSWLFKYPNSNSMAGQLCKNVNKFNPDKQLTLSSNMLCESNYNNSNRCLIEHPIEYKFQCQFKCPFPCYCYTTDDFSIVHYYCSNSQLKFIPQWVNSDQLDSQSEIIVWLNGNNFSEIRNENFTDYDNITQLYLKNSQITSIDPLTFKKMTKLKFLDLSYNQLTTIKDGTFNQLIYLEILILSNNLIAYLPDNCFNNTKALKSLQLHNNKLTNYSIENLRNRPILRELTLHNNSWTCNCSFIIEFQNYLVHNSYSVENQTEIYCVYENGSLANSPVSEYNTSHCADQNETTIDNTWPIVIGIIAPLCVFAIVYGVIRGIKSCVRAKRAKQIERAYRLMKNAGTPIETDGKVFDVFISYSNEDSDFVATKIVPKLEDINNPYHVCVHERNFLGGGSIEDTIIEAIKKSTRIIVILTENYLQSDWCMYEFVIAHSVMIEDQCPRVVLIIKDNLPPDINPNLQIYMSTNTYIEWTDQKFWQRLHFALSSNKLSMEQTLQPMNFLMSTRFIMPDD
ncbi:TOLL-like receptor [Chamberlinius hualienensis]